MSEEEKLSYADKPWLKSYVVGPFKLKHTMEPYPKINVYKFLEESTKNYPDNIACVYLDDEITYKDLKIKVDKLANAFIDLGLKKGETIASILPSCVEFILVDYAAMKMGAIHVPLSILHNTDDLIHELKESGAKSVVCSYRRLERVNEVKKIVDIQTIIYAPTRLFPDYKLPETEDISEDGYYSLENIMQKYTPLETTVEVNATDDIALLPFTGGTTGLPKGTMLTHYNITTNIAQLFHWMMDPLKVGIIGKAAILVCVPVFHAYGHFAIHSGISWGLKIFLMDPRDMLRIAETIKKNRPFMVTGVPAHYLRFLDLDIPKAPIFYLSGAAPMPPDLAEQFEQKSGVPMGEGYGATETTAVSTVNISPLSKVTGFMATKKSGVGVPVPDTEVKIVDPDTQKELPFGESGEIWVRGPQVMKGYWPTKGSGLTEDGWLPMGDIGRMDDDGYFYIEDRIKDMINVSGNKVYSRVIDDILHEHPAIGVAGVIGIPDTERPGSERVKAFISLNKGYEDKVTEQEIIDYLKDKVKPYAVPKYVEFRKDLPLTLAMKLFKRKLRDEEIAKMREKGEIK
ncbi:MAG: class I adenylate-forming enzyme family protein [Promethearchaeota archaeon]|jgi:long-chain acyl-CoA synthetase